MAGNIGDLQVNLSANTSQMERDVSAALKRLESKGFNFGAGINAKAFTQPLGRITGASNEFQKSLDASNARVIAFGASAGAIYTVQKAFTSLISSTIEVQKSLTDINVILGASQKTLGQFGDSLFEIAKNSGQAFSTVATAAGELARQGLTVEQTLKRTSDALVLARLSGLDAASSVEALTASLNSFNTSALDSTQIVNKLASVDAAFAVSSADLAEALKRVGSSAQDVGVSFDELLAIVASVNQTTARGGAVIGNSLKTIFTRVQRTEVLDQLEALGIAVRDLNGNAAPAIQVLTGLAGKFDELGSAQKGQVAELVGGVFQINILKAALGDLSKQYSVYGNALKISQGATDEATRRNEELNKTLSALLNRTLVNLTKVGSDIGSLSFAPAIEKVLGGINTALEAFDVKGDSIGGKIGKGIFEGIGSFVSGPGLALLIGVFLKIFGNLAKFTTDAVRTVLGLNKEAQAQAQIQERINNILSQNPQLIQNILNKQVSLLQVEKDILTVIQAQSQARQQSTAIATSLTRGLISKGVTSEKGVITARTKSQGFIPNFSANREVMGAIAGGYMPGNVRSMNIPNYGRVTYNDAETVKQFSGLSQPGIMPPANSDAGKAYKEKFKNKYGIDPYASSGFVPNFGVQTLTQPYPYAAVKSTDRQALSKQFKSYEESKALGTYAKASDKGNIVNSRSVDRYGALYPSFSQNAPGKAVGISGGNKYGFVTYPFPGGSFDLNQDLYEDVRKNLIDISSNYFKKLITQPKIIDTTRFKTNISSNLSRSAVESSLGQVFEAGIKSSISSLTLSEIANFDLNRSELSDIQKKFDLPYTFGSTYLADLKNSLSVGNLNSVAGKISASSGEKLSSQDTIRFQKTQARLQNQFSKKGYEKLSGEEAEFVRLGKFKSQGFIPNFSPLDRALNTEGKMGGRGVLDFKPGLGLYVRDGKTQPNFAAVMRDHPEGIGNAVQNSKKMQSMMSGGFIPNFAGFDPMSLFFMMQSMSGAGGSEGTESKLERSRLASILRERRAAQQLLKAEEAKEIKDQAQINYLKNEQRQLLSQENKQRTAMNNQMGVLAKDKGGKIIGGVGGALGRFGSRYGAGLALGAPLLADTASQFIGDENTRGGRATKAGVSGLGLIGSYAGLGSLIAPGYGTAIGAGVGGIMAAYDVFQKLNDIMPDVAKRVEAATEKFNNISSATQTLSVSLETLSSIENRADLSAQTRIELRMKAEEDFAKSISQLDQALPGAGKQITDLYTRIGDTAELRQKIIQLQTEAQRESKGFGAAASLLGTNEKIKSLTDLGIFQKAATLSGSLSEDFFRTKNLNNLNGMQRAQYNQQIQSGGMQLYELFGNLSKNGPISSEQIGQIQAGLKNGKGLDGIKSLLDSLTENGDYSKIIAEDLNVLIENKTLEPMLEAFKKFQERQEIIRKNLDEANQQIATGGREIKDLATYGRAFSGTTPISSQALGRIDYSSIGEQMNISRGQAFGQQVQTQFEQLGQEIGNSSENIKYFSQFTEEAGNIQKDLANKTITLSQATERLKLVFDKVSFEKNAPFMFSDERASARQSLMERSLKQGKFAEGFDPLTSFFDKFGDNAATTADKINKSFANLADNLQGGFEDAFGAFVDGTKTADQAFQDMLLSISQQIIKEQFSIGMRSLLGGLTGGGGYGEQGGGGGLLSGIFGGILGKANGGIIKKYSSGGSVNGGSGVKDDVPAMLTDGEYVLRKSAVNKYGKGMLDMLNQGGMVKGYAGGGRISGLLSNSYDFFGASGEKLTQNYTPEAFKTTVNAPSELGNVPALTGRFNISDMLSSRALMDENNPMNALRTQRFLGMQNYQEQVSNFKTGYNEQYRQVEEQRRLAQKAADEENSRRMSAYNSQRSQMLIGGLTSAALSGFSALSSSGMFGGGLQGLFGGGGGGGGGLGGSILSGIQSIFGNVSSNRQQNSSMSTTFGRSPEEAAEFSKALKENIERGQFGGYGDDYFRKQSQLFPQFGGQGGFGGGMGGNNFGPTSSIGGFQFGVGLGAPAGFQTQTQNAQQDYLMNFASPIAPVAPGRGNLVYDFLNQNSNPFGYNRGYAKGGVVKGYADGGKVSKFAQTYYPYAVRAAQRLGTSPEAILAQLAFESNYGTSGLSQKSFNLGGIQAQKDYQGQTISMPANADERARGDFAPKSYRSYNNPEEFFNDYVGFLSKDRYSKTIGVTDPAQRAQLLYEAGYAGEYPGYSKQIASVAGKIKSFLPSNIAGTKTPAVMAGFGLPSRDSFPLTAFSPSTNQIAKGIDTIGIQPNPFTNQARSTDFATTSPIMYSMTPDMNRNQSTFYKEAGKGILAGGAAGYGLKKIIESNLGQEGLMSTLRSAYGGTFKSSLLPSRNYGSNFVKPATAIDKMFLPLNTPPTIMPKQLIAPNEMADILKYAKSPAMGPAGEFSKLMPKQLVDPSEAANILKYSQSGALKPSLLSRSLSSLKGFGAGIVKGAPTSLIGEQIINPTSFGYGQGGAGEDYERGYRNYPDGELTELGKRVLGTDNTSVQIPLFRNKQGEIPGDRSTYTPERIAKAATQQSVSQQTSSQQYPWEDIAFQLQTYLDETSSKSTNLYKSVGSLYDMKNKGDYGRLSSKFSSFYGNDSKNRYSSFGEKGFNNYLNYIGANPFSSLSQLNSFKFPMTPGMYSPFAFGSQNFGGFGGTGYQSGFNSLGNVFSNYFSTGSRLGITPSWASRANGGMIYGGTSVKDDVPAMLMGGEYVIRKDAVDRFGQPFFDRLNRGQVTGFAEGGPVGTSLPSVGGGGANQQDNSRNQFVESITKLVKSLEQLNKGIEEQNRGAKDQAEGTASDSTGASGVTNNISINVNVDQNGKTTDSTKQEDQNSGTKEETDQEKFKKTMERSRVLAELLRQQVLKVIVEEQRPGGVLYQGSKGRDMGR
jgi:TP901 family phage tail tape measure protein